MFFVSMCLRSSILPGVERNCDGINIEIVPSQDL